MLSVVEDCWIVLLITKATHQPCLQCSVGKLWQQSVVDFDADVLYIGATHLVDVVGEGEEGSKLDVLLLELDLEEGAVEGGSYSFHLLVLLVLGHLHLHYLFYSIIHSQRKNFTSTSSSSHNTSFLSASAVGCSCPP